MLGYADYRNFQSVIESARTACFNSGQRVEDHFVEVTEMVEIGSGHNVPCKTVMMSRYACYLVIQNADPAKEIVAQGQTYFAIQTRRQELSDEEVEEQRRLAAARRKCGPTTPSLPMPPRMRASSNPTDYAIFQNHGYMGLYGGLGAQDIHRRKGLKKSEQILDHMGSTELAANLFRATQAEDKLRREKITGKDQGQPGPPGSGSQSPPDHQGTRRHHAGGTAQRGKHEEAGIQRHGRPSRSPNPDAIA